MILRTTQSVLAALAISAGPAVADSITLRRSVEIAPNTPITLADVATLDGPAAEELGGLVVADSIDDLPGGAGARRLELSVVRGLIDADPRTNWAFLSLRGAETLVRTDGPRVEAARKAEPPAPVAEEQHPETLEQLDPGSIRALAQRVLIRILRVEPGDLRATWSAKDAELLDQQVGGRNIHVQPLGSSRRLPLRVTVYEGDRMTLNRVIRAEIEVRRTAQVVARAAPRGTMLTEDHVTPRAMWLAPDIDPAATVVGEVAARRLDPGAIIEAGDVAPPMIVGRGKVTMLHCVAGAVALRTPARALEDGRDGETIRFEMLSTGKRVTARITGTPNGPVRAVLAMPSAADHHPAADPPDPGADR
jgi:flagella basal body P-ring formation protein FlgA